jgi:restriction system protein
MARRSSFLGTLERVARAAARAQREAEAQRRRQIRDQTRNERESLRLRQQYSKLERQQYLASRESEAARLNVELETEIASIRGVLAARQNSSEDRITASIMPKHEPPVQAIAKELVQESSPPNHSTFTARVKPLVWWERLFKRTARQEKESADAETAYQLAMQEYEADETSRRMKLRAAKEEHARRVEFYEVEYSEKRKEAEEFIKQFRSGDPAAVRTYFNVVLSCSPYPDGFPQDYRTVYDEAARQLVIDYELPTVDVIPPVGEYRFVKTKDVVDEKPRKPAEIKELYRGVIAAICLRCLHECFATDGSGVLSVVTFNGYVNTIDPATGNKVRPYVISVRTTRERFGEITLDRVDTKACLRNLGAQVSSQPSELVPVKPIIEFDMIDKRFIGECDVLSEIDSRPNLMDLTPAEFEALVGNLFTKMGLETKLTRTSRDGGVDAIAFDTRPILGGKVVIQAKRYRHTVGVSAVRDLYGTMMNEGANKGILVATSSYGPDAYDFCKDKPIELVDGGGLLYHLEQVGVKARIVFPDDVAASA